MQCLDRRIALVTGGAAGLGKAIAQRLAADGATVVITDIQSETGLATAAENDFLFLQQDVSDEAHWEKVVRNVQEQRGGLHILVNNAGITGRMDAVNPVNTPLSEWKKVFAVNLDGVFLGCRAVIPAIHLSGGGSIVNIASMAGLWATPYATAYGASKAAVRQLTKSVAQHCAQEKLNIRCNSVHPGLIRTELWERHARERAFKAGISFDQMLSDTTSSIPLGDFTLPEDVAATVSFLASEDARHITGAKMIVDGGMVHCDTYQLYRKR